MRTTIDISEEQRAALLRIAARRGEKGFSSVVREALDLYLAHHASRADAVRAALAARGALAGPDGEALGADVEESRRRWR